MELDYLVKAYDIGHKAIDIVSANPLNCFFTMFSVGCLVLMAYSVKGIIKDGKLIKIKDAELNALYEERERRWERLAEQERIDETENVLENMCFRG